MEEDTEGDFIRTSRVVPEEVMDPEAVGTDW